MGFHSYGQARKKVKFWIYLLFCYFSSSNFNLKTLHWLFIFKQKIHKKTKINWKIDRGAHLETLHAPKYDQILSFFNFFFVYGFCSFFCREFDQWYKLLFYHAIEFNKRVIFMKIGWAGVYSLRPYMHQIVTRIAQVHN